MRKIILTAIWIYTATLPLLADWELSSKNLQRMIEKADVIVEGRLTSKRKVKISDTMKGPQEIRKIKLQSDADLQKFKLKLNYIMFFSLSNSKFTLRNEIVIKSDVLIKTRVREMVMKSRVKKSAVVVAAKVVEKRDVVVSDTEKYTLATCEVVKNYKGECSKIFEVVYRSDKEKYAKRVFLFPRLSYVFFLNENKKPHTIHSWDVRNASFFAQKLLSKNPKAKYFRKFLSKKNQKILQILAAEDDRTVAQAFFRELNRALRKKSMFNAQMFPSTLQGSEATAEDIAHTNRSILVSSYPDAFRSGINRYVINRYDGAIADRRYILKEVTKASSVTSSFEEEAGKEFKGLKIFGQSAQPTFSKDDPVSINLLVQNIDKADITVCNSHIPYLLEVNIVDINHNKLVLDEGLKPFKKMKKSFVKLSPNRYIVIPPINLREYCTLPPGKYGVYIRLNVPVSYARTKSDAWIGKILTNFIEFEIAQ